MDDSMADNQSHIQGQYLTSSVHPMPDVGLPKYFDYPTCKPFINTDFTRADGSINSFPTSDRDAVISALRNLHKNVKKLEIEKNITEHNLQSLTSETEQYKELLNIGNNGKKNWEHPGEQTQGEQVAVNMQARELESELISAEHRCHLLEKQLQQMRKMVETSEQDRRDLMEQKRKVQQMKDMTGTDIKFHMKRLNELEKEQRRLTLTQTLAETQERSEGSKVESKIRDLEQEVREEKMQRETLQERTAQLETAAQNKAYPSSTSALTLFDAHHTQARKTKPTKKKSKSAPTKHSTSACRSEPRRHYRLDLTGIPFVAGKSTGPSHSLGANVQKVLAMLKLHNAALCSSVYANGDYQGPESLSSSCLGDADVDQDLSDLLIQLQDEFGQLSSKHQEILEQIHMARDVQVKKQLEQELDILLENMENKSQQISIIKQHQKRTKDVKRVRTSARGTKSKQTLHTATRNYHHHQLNNTNASNINAIPRSNTCNNMKDSISIARPELFMLRDIKKLQCRLRKEDLYWE